MNVPAVKHYQAIFAHELLDCPPDRVSADAVLVG
jgi:hypothetical protein